MSFTDDLQAFRLKMEQRAKDTLAEAVTLVHESITVGSPITGAPGQPVDTGNLLASWQATFPDDVTGRVATNVVYAPGIEDGVGPHGPITQRSRVGGFHSVKLTVASWDRVQAEALRRAKGEAPASA